MCYSIYISTDSSEDLTQRNSNLVIFKKITDKLKDQSISLLSFPNVWYVGSQHDCSCGFRHIMSDDLGFSDPVDWYEENKEDIEATKHVYRIFLKIIEQGNTLDCIDKWEETDIKNIKTREICFKEISETQFRFFENYLFKVKQ